MYRDDLAFIHVDGYGFHWEGASPAILKWFEQANIRDGLVVDLGCGGGQWLDQLTTSGYDTFGVDISPAMIRAAKKRSPQSQYVCGSFADVDLPTCDAVTSLGEPLNYLNSGPAMRRTFRVVFQSLRSGGLFVFDVRHPANHPVPPRDHFKSAPNWFCYARIEEDPRAGSLVRHITSFRRKGKSAQFRRDTEIHRLKLFSRNEMCEWLRDTGFRVRTRKSYGNYLLSARQSIFICRKP